MAAGTSPSALVVQSRHPGRYPKLESFTLSYPAFEPLTEHHALPTGLFNEATLRRYPRGRTMLSVCLAAQQVSQSLELRTILIVLLSEALLQVESAMVTTNLQLSWLRDGVFEPTL